MNRRLASCIALLLALVFLGGIQQTPAVASPKEVSTSVRFERSENALVEQAAKQIMNGFSILEQALVRDGGRYSLNEYLLTAHGAQPEDVSRSRELVDLLNASSQPRHLIPRDRSWMGYGECIVAGVTGFQLKEISSYVNWKEFGPAIKNREYARALSFLKSGISRYMAKRGVQMGAKIALKEIINSSGVGFAAQAAVAATGCALMEGWRWFIH